MKKAYKIILELVKSALTGEKAILPYDTDWKSVVSIAASHQIVPMVFYGLKNSNIQTPYDETLFDIVSRHIIIEENQIGALKKMTEAFSINNIDYAVLKGSKLKNLYPSTEMRVMGDLDILIKPRQYHHIKKIMLENGFSESFIYDYEYHWKKGCALIELHKSLVSSYQTDLYSYFSDIWNMLTPEQDKKNSFTLSKEDEFIYIFAHLTRHYRSGGIGIIHFTDIFVFKHNHPDLDEEYLKASFKKLGFCEFYLNVMSTIENWFMNGEASETTEIISNRVFESGSFGTTQSRYLNQVAKEVEKSGNVRKVWSKRLVQTIFMPINSMKNRYPILRHAPILLPVMWVRRWVSAVFKPSKILIQLKLIKKINSKSIAEYKDQLKKVGL